MQINLIFDSKYQRLKKNLMLHKIMLCAVICAVEKGKEMVTWNVRYADTIFYV